MDINFAAKTENNLEQHLQVITIIYFIILSKLHIKVNHLGHFLICLELLPCMMSTEGDKRIVLVSSRAHEFGVWDPNNLQGDTGYGRVKFYGNSKLYNVSVVYLLTVVLLLHILR